MLKILTFAYRTSYFQFGTLKYIDVGTYLGAVVVIFAGSLNEKLGTKESDPDGLYINGDGAITAQVTVYGPKGESDIARYTGFTMSSDFKKTSIYFNVPN